MIVPENPEAEMPITGERMVSQLFDMEIGKEDVFDHLHRYARAFDFVAGKNVLDIASGEGYGSYLLSKYAKQVVGVDISAEAVEFANVKYKGENIRFIAGSADDIPADDSTIDVVVSFETLEHHDKHEEMFREIKRVLRPGGVLIMSTPDKDYYRVAATKNEFHVKELDLEEFKNLIKTHFKNFSMLYQRYVETSIICAENGSGELVEYQGDFKEILSSNNIQRPNYNICIASDNAIGQTYSSIFHNYHLKPIIHKYEQELAIRKLADEVLQSKTYRLGYYLSSPFRIIRSIMG